MIIMMTFMGTSMFSMIWVLLASLLVQYTIFEFWPALLLSTAAGLVFIYSIITDFEQEAELITSRLQKRGLEEEGPNNKNFIGTFEE